MSLLNMKFSKSSLKLYKQCPFAWKLSYIDNTKPKTAIFTLGKDVHTFLQKNIDTEPLSIVSVLKEKKEPVWKSVFLFLNVNDWKGRVVGKEKVYKDENFVGVVDVIVEKDGGYWIYDYKTLSKIEKNIDKWLDELILYAYLFEKNEGKKVKGVGVVELSKYYPDVEVLEYELREGEKEKVVKEYLGLKKEILEKVIEYKNGKENVFEKKIGKHCKVCPFKKYCYGGKNEYGGKR